ncbi:hypothetical protein JCM6882_006661 [Rhodosporidiobolus microsporus]
MQSDTFGMTFGADQAFAACAGGMSIAEYCTKTPEDLCCGICNNIPITGFGTFLSVVLGTLFNLLITLWWKIETPYNLAFQFLSTDGMALSHVVQFYNSTSNNRPLTLFHYCFVPLSVLSAVPMLIACSLAELNWLHAIPSAAEVELQVARQRELDAAHGHPPTGHTSALERRGSRSSQPVSMNSLSSPSWIKRPKGKERAKSAPTPHIKHSAPPTPKRPRTRYNVVHKYYSVNALLPQLAKWVSLGHLIAYAGIFAMVFFGVKNTAQDNCIEEYHLEQWRIGMGVFSLVILIIGAAFWCVIYKALGKKNLSKDSPQNGLHIILHAVLRGWSAKHVESSRISTTWRYSICAVAYLIWAVPYVGIYFVALNKFILFGTNPMPYEQISAAVSVVSPIVVCARTWMENRDGWADKQKKLNDIAEVDGLAKKDDELHHEITRLSSGSGGVGPSRKKPGHHASGALFSSGDDDNGGEGPSGIKRTGSNRSRKSSDGGYFKHDPRRDEKGHQHKGFPALSNSGEFPPAPPGEQHRSSQDRHRYDDVALSSSAGEGEQSSSSSRGGDPRHSPPVRRSSLTPSLVGLYGPVDTFLQRPESASSNQRGKRPMRA